MFPYFNTVIGTITIPAYKCSEPTSGLEPLTSSLYE